MRSSSPSPSWPLIAGSAGDIGGDLHLVASLAAEMKVRLAQAVEKSRQEGLSWAEIADLLGVTRASAWQRFADKAP